MTDSTFKFDLQLFADQEGGEQANTEGGENKPNTSDGTDNGGSILGSAGMQENNGGQGEPQQTNPPEPYDFSGIVPDGMEYDAKSAQEYGAIARECGLTQEQASKIASYGMQFMQNGVNAAMAQVAATQQKWAEDAKAQLGAEFDKTVARAAVGINRLERSVPNLRQVLNETGAGNRIEMIQLMAAIGDLVGEDNGHGVPGYGGEKSLYPNTNFGQYK
jgi:hypothetical protein